jgi:hypothetical protein
MRCSGILGLPNHLRFGNSWQHEVIFLSWHAMSGKKPWRQMKLGLSTTGSSPPFNPDVYGVYVYILIIFSTLISKLVTSRNLPIFISSYGGGATCISWRGWSISWMLWGFQLLWVREKTLGIANWQCQVCRTCLGHQDSNGNQLKHVPLKPTTRIHENSKHCVALECFRWV